MARILLIDDESILRGTIGRLLNRYGHTVVEASDGREGLEVASDAPVDLVVTDLKMPGMDGSEVVARLDPELPIIGMSGDVALWEERIGGAEGRSAPFTLLPKPFGLGDFMAAVDGALEGREIREQAVVS